MLCINITFGAGNKPDGGKAFDFSYFMRNIADNAEKLIKKAKKIRIKLLKTLPKQSESAPKNKIMKRKNIFKLIASIVICQAAALIGSMFTLPAVGGWYAELNKPSWTPSGGVIGAVWTVIYLLMGASLYLAWAKNFQISENLSGMAARAWNRISQKLLDGAWQKQNIIAIFSVQLILNVLWSFVFFELKMPGWAFFELLMLWVAVAYTIANFRRVSKPAAYLLLPYIAWITFAGYLNFVIWRMN